MSAGVSAVVVAGLLGGAVALTGPAGPVRPRPARRTRRRRAPRPAPDADLLAGARLAERVAALLGAGLAPRAAWEHAGAQGPGGGDGVEVAPAVAAVRRLVESTGAPAVVALTACAGGLRAEADARAAVRTAVAGAAVSARTVSLLPLAGMLLGAVLGAPPWESLLATAAGRGCLVVGLVLLVLGRRWSRRLVETARRAGA